MQDVLIIIGAAAVGLAAQLGIGWLLQRMYPAYLDTEL